MATAAAAIALASASSALAAYTFTDISLPGATGTEPTGINNSGVVVGVFRQGGGVYGYTGNPSSGCCTTYAEGGATETRLTGINNAGDVVGYFATAGGEVHGLVGGFPFDFPGATGTTVTGINNTGTIIGNVDSALPTYGFSETGGVFTAIVGPVSSPETLARGVNDAGDIVGTYESATFASHGFLDVGGVYTTVDVAGATQTEVRDINNAGVMVGFYTDSAQHTFGFVDDHGVFTTIQAPGAGLNTYISGINDAGDLVGSTVDALGNESAFLATQAVVPEPAAWALMLVGFGGVGAALRSRRRAVLA